MLPTQDEGDAAPTLANELNPGIEATGGNEDGGMPILLPCREASTAEDGDGRSKWDLESVLVPMTGEDKLSSNDFASRDFRRYIFVLVIAELEVNTSASVASVPKAFD